MPPYTPVTSKAQSRKLFALAHQGKVSLDDAKGKTRAADFESLPEQKSDPHEKSSGSIAALRRKIGR